MDTLSVEDLNDAMTSIGGILKQSSFGMKPSRMSKNGDRAGSTTIDDSVTFQIALNDMKERLSLEYEKKLVQLDAAWRAKYQNLKDREIVNNSSREISQKAELEANEEVIKSKYAAKLKKIEKTMLQTQQAYRDKILSLQSALQESRNELKVQKEEFHKREMSYQEEFSLKDRRLNKVHSKLSDILSKAKNRAKVCTFDFFPSFSLSFFCNHAYLLSFSHSILTPFSYPSCLF